MNQKIAAHREAVVVTLQNTNIADQPARARMRKLGVSHPIEQAFGALGKAMAIVVDQEQGLAWVGVRVGKRWNQVDTIIGE